MKYISFVLLGVGALLVSCTDSRKVQYNESKYFPFENTFQGSDFYAYKSISESDIRNLFNVPSDATIESFTVNGFSLEVVPDLISPADVLDYNFSFSYNDDPDYYYDLLTGKDISASYGKSLNISNNLSDRLKGNELKALTCCLGKMLGSKNLKGCNNDSEVGNFKINCEAKLKSGTPSYFSGTVKGYLSAQITYTVCESLPEGIFASGLEKCE